MDFEKQLASLKLFLEGRIDFHGQCRVDTLAKQILWGAAVVAFVLGFSFQSLKVTFGIVGIAALTCGIVIIPSYPTYNSHPIEWLPTLTADGQLPADVGKKER